MMHSSNQATGHDGRSPSAHQAGINLGAMALGGLGAGPRPAYAGAAPATPVAESVPSPANQAARSAAPGSLTVNEVRRRSSSRRRRSADDAPDHRHAGNGKPDPQNLTTRPATADPDEISAGEEDEAAPSSHPVDAHQGDRPAPDREQRRHPGHTPPQPAPPVTVRTGNHPSPAGRTHGRPQQFNRHVCPFCGHKRDVATDSCPGCGMPDNAETRSATTSRLGPWFVLQPHNPAAPGMRFSVLMELVRTGQVTAGTIVRGPTTQQLWTYAARARGLAHFFGICWSCNRRMPPPKQGEEPDDFCIYCGALIEPPTNPDQQLEALGTLQIAPSPREDNESRSGRGATRSTGNGGGFNNRPPLPAMRRTIVPRPLPPAGDGGDALLSTRELATAFNLDRRRSVWSSAAGLPWGKTLMLLMLLILVVIGGYVAFEVLWEPIAGMFP